MSQDDDVATQKLSYTSEEESEDFLHYLDEAIAEQSMYVTFMKKKIPAMEKELKMQTEFITSYRVNKGK